MVPPLIMAKLAGDAGSSRHWSGLAKERTGRAAGDTASPELVEGRYCESAMLRVG